MSPDIETYVTTSTMTKKREQHERDELFKDAIKPMSTSEKKLIKRYKKPLDRALYRRSVAGLILTSLGFFAYDIYQALQTDQWNPITLNELLRALELTEITSEISLIEDILHVPLYLFFFLLGIAIFIVF